MDTYHTRILYAEEIIAIKWTKLSSTHEINNNKFESLTIADGLTSTSEGICMII